MPDYVLVGRLFRWTVAALVVTLFLGVATLLIGDPFDAVYELLFALVLPWTVLMTVVSGGVLWWSRR